MWNLSLRKKRKLEGEKIQMTQINSDPAEERREPKKLEREQKPQEIE